VCEKSFSRSATLNSHISVHMGAKPTTENCISFKLPYDV